ncbi:MAG: hypothetical protein GSR77_02095 [Desulfurococcales archaeon]|nr:hypothetical protein [Desulfurococcales archaeon]
MMLACDERSPVAGGEKEEPNEPPIKITTEDTDEGCKVRVLNGAPVIRRIEVVLKEPFYHFNSLVGKYGFYIKPVHKIYKTINGVRRVYAYYGKYWLKRKGNKVVYAGSQKPRVIPDNVMSKLQSFTIIFEEEDVIMDCWVYEKLKKYFEGLHVEKTF